MVTGNELDRYGGATLERKSLKRTGDSLRDERKSAAGWDGAIIHGALGLTFRVTCGQNGARVTRLLRQPLKSLMRGFRARLTGRPPEWRLRKPLQLAISEQR